MIYDTQAGKYLTRAVLSQGNRAMHRVFANNKKRRDVVLNYHHSAKLLLLISLIKYM